MENEKRLIDANALDRKLEALAKKYAARGRFEAAKDYSFVQTVLLSAPTVDAIVPPVNIGQILWCNIPHSELPFECRVYSICREERNGLILDYFRCTVKGWFGKAFSFEDVGKTIFLTEAEALAKMDGGNEDGSAQV